ncbi:class I SAM-dependent methyltransferase [Blastomonas sp.]|uniref:class I SAM-dependent methyltransferase n=1 Tax=Blastomonas sp. TaxID=1909299 RepID=UPI002620CE23|nr:class I SAM-dependent methyltransferase [Blastomonas sp.]MDM7957512.1 class I SAM-dependent methyltransferase [Blastomonas sp.]
MNQRVSTDFSRHRSTFQKIWQGGYYGGDPLDPVLAREYGDLSLISVNHAVYQALVRPNVNSETKVLEIGPGRGAWTKSMLNAKEIWCFDALSAEHNNFWEYVGPGNKSKINYFEVSDASLTQAPDDHFDFIFSFGAFCHIPVDIQRAYQENLFKKAKSGAKGVIMFADFDKFNHAFSNLSKLRTVPVNAHGLSTTLRFNVARMLARIKRQPFFLEKDDHTEKPGRFYHGNIKQTAEHLEAVGWRVIVDDINLNFRDPIVYFEKP